MTQFNMLGLAMLKFMGENPIFTFTFLGFYLMGVLCAASALLRSRTPQGATAWVVGLITMPFFTVPLFMIFGRSKFYGYALRRKSFDQKVESRFGQYSEFELSDENFPEEMRALVEAMKPLVGPGFTNKNSVKLLVNARDTYSAMLESIHKARSYILFQFYVFRADATGALFAQALMERARAGVKVYFLYDEIGSEIPSEFLDELKASGMEVCYFNSLGSKGRFQINFRNHRKLILVDGAVAYIGGMNIGDDYLGLWPILGPWRDTHLRLEGPSVLAGQLVFAKDWYWCKKEELKVSWRVNTVENQDNATVLILPSGPADQKQTCLLAHIALVNSAKERLWIANPYLVPPESLLDAIILASMRGVDVRVLIPSYSDAWVVMVASTVYVKRLLEHGVKVYRYKKGFLHQKVMLVDDLIGLVGSANLDFRSMFINFEVSVLAREKEFLKDLEKMLQIDYAGGREMSLSEFQHLSLWQRLTARAANLLAPVL